MHDIETFTDEELEEKISKCHQYIGPQIDRGHTSLVDSIRNTLEQLMLEKEIRSHKKQQDLIEKELNKQNTSITDPLNIGVVDLPEDSTEDDK